MGAASEPLVTRRRRPVEGTAGATVSVVIPCHNYAQYVRQAVGSALGQQGVEVEVIVVDDASSDDSLAVVRALAEQDPRVRVIANEQNLGPVGTFNRGLAAATGEFLVRLDADDLLTPGSSARAVAVMQQLPDVGLVYGHPLHFTGDRRPPARMSPDGWLVWSGREWLGSRCRDGTNVITSPEAVMRHSVVDRVGGQRPLAHTHDMEMWLRMAAHADVAYVEGADQAWHREHPGSLSTHAEDPLVILAELRDAFDLLFSGLEPGFAEREELHRTARLAVARQALARAARLADRGAALEEVRALLAFALACSSDLTEVKGCARLMRMVQEPGRRPGASTRRLTGVFPRLRRRADVRLRRMRWEKTGVYERVLVTDENEVLNRGA